MKKKALIGLTITFLLMCISSFSTFVFAEVIILKTGKKVEGKIIERTDEYIKIEFYGVPIPYYFEDIERIEEETPTIPLSSSSKEAESMSNKGTMLIIEGKRDEGLKLMKQATLIAPEDHLLHMNYASMLFEKGRQTFQAGDKEEAKTIFKEVENELLLAIKLSRENDNIVKSQCYFLLGEAYFHIFEDKEKAKMFYEKSVDQLPEHGGAIEALKRFEVSAQEYVNWTTIMLDRFFKLTDNDFAQTNKLSGQIPLAIDKYSKPTIIVSSKSLHDGDIILVAEMEDGKDILFSFFGTKFWNKEIPLAIELTDKKRSLMPRERVTKEQAELFKELFIIAEQEAVQQQGEQQGEQQGGCIIFLEDSSSPAPK